MGGHGRCFLEVYRRFGEVFIRSASSLVGVDSQGRLLQSLPTEPPIMFTGDYVGLRVEDGLLFNQWTDGGGGHI